MAKFLDMPPALEPARWRFRTLIGSIGIFLALGCVVIVEHETARTPARPRTEANQRPDTGDEDTPSTKAVNFLVKLTPEVFAGEPDHDAAARRGLSESLPMFKPADIKPVVPLSVRSTVAFHTDSRYSAFRLLAPVYLLTLPSDRESDPEKILSLIESLTFVEYAEISRPIILLPNEEEPARAQRSGSTETTPTPSPTPTPAATPAYTPCPAQDPLFNVQWYLTDSLDRDIDAPEAWCLLPSDPKPVIVAIIDTGIMLTHSDLKNKLWRNEAECNGVPGADDDCNGFVDDCHGWNWLGNDPDVSDAAGHGTQCAGVIGAAHDAVGIAGVAPNSRLMALKFTNGVVGEPEISKASLAIAYATAQGAQVINMSWVYPSNSPTLKMVLNQSSNFAVLVAGAGNYNETYPLYPAAYPFVIGVGATWKGDYGVEVIWTKCSTFNSEIYAPGAGIITPSAYTCNGVNYCAITGTSMSSPVVAGIAALLIAQKANEVPPWNFEQFRNRILQAGEAQVSPQDIPSTHGLRISAVRALEP